MSNNATTGVNSYATSWDKVDQSIRQAKKGRQKFHLHNFSRQSGRFATTFRESKLVGQFLRQPVLWDDRKCRLFLEILRAFWDDHSIFIKEAQKKSNIMEQRRANR